MTTPGIYWKEEPQKRPWKYVPYTQDVLRQVVKMGGMFITTTQFEFEPVNGHGEPKRFGDLILDFDCKDNPQIALDEMRTLCLVYLPEVYDIDPDCIEFFASGSKGYHAKLPAWAFGHSEGHQYLPLIYKRIVTQWAKDLGIKTLDMSLYCMKQGKMVRLANVRREIGTYKVPLTIQEVMQLDATQHAKLTEAPRKIDLVEVDEQVSEELKGLWEEASESVKAYEQARSEPMLDEQLAQIKDAPPPCLRYLLNNHPPKSDHFNFNQAALLLVTYFQDCGYKYEQALELSHKFLDIYPYSESYSTPQLRLDHFEKMWQYVLSEFGYFFNCQFALALRMPKEAYDCLHCLQKVDIIITEPEKTEDRPVTNSLDFPFQVMTGAAGYFADTFGAVMETPQHFLFMSYLTCLGAYFSPDVKIDSELHTQPRLFTVLMGESATTRKSTTLTKTVGVFKDAFVDFEACWGIGSAEGLQRVLKKKDSAALVIDRQNVLFVFDEFKSFVNKCQIDTSVLLPAFTSLFENNIYETHVKQRSVSIEDAFVSLLAATTNETYERIYNNAFIAIGFPNRVFLVPGNAERRFSIPPKVPDDERNQIRLHLIELRNFVRNGLVLEIAEDAKDFYHQWYMDLEASVHSKRLDTYSIRFMQLLALNSLKRTVDVEIVEHATALCNWQLLVRQVHDPIDADSKVAAMEQKIRRVLKKGSLTEVKLKDRTNAYRSGLWLFKTALDNLKGATEIAFDKKSKKWILI